MLLDREEYDTPRVVLEIELLHDVIFVIHNCPVAHLEDGGDFFHAASFSQQLQNFALGEPSTPSSTVVREPRGLPSFPDEASE